MINYAKNGSKTTENSKPRNAEAYRAVTTKNLTANPGDRIADEPQSIEEKAKQLAVDAPDITGDHIKVPTYFIVEYPNGEKKALHHVKDAQKISDVIRQAHFYEEGEKYKLGEVKQQNNFNLAPIILIVALCLLSFPILIGIF